ncbi:MAG: hypothetical protein M1351_02740 [Candidatus Thermoplasmatota archaeon]|nr:hypothetical protein [Candidatus Thermoplasmatota archaeon]
MAFAIVIFLLAALPVFDWFKYGHVIYFTDATLPFNPLLDLHGSFYLWSMIQNYGAPNLSITFMPYYLAMTILSFLFPLWLSQAILWYFVFFVAGFGMFLLSRHFYPIRENYRIGAIIAGISYMYTPFWIFDGLQDPWTGVIGYALLPLFLLTFRKIMEEAMHVGKSLNVYHAVFLLLLFCALPAFTSPFIFTVLMAIGGFFLYIALFESATSKRIWPLLTSTAILFGLTLLVFSFWWGMFYGLSNLSGVSALTVPSSLHNTLYYWLQGNSFGMFNSIFNIGIQAGAKYPPIFAWSWVQYYSTTPWLAILNFGIPFGAWVSLLFFKKIQFQFYRFSLFTALFGVFLLNGVSEPTGVLYTWLFNHFPFWWTFDNPHMWFSPLVYLSYSFMFGVTFSEMCSYVSFERYSNLLSKQTIVALLMSKRTRETSVVGLSILLALFVIMLPVTPLLNGSAVPHGNPSAQVELPAYEASLVRYFNSQAGVFEILSLPLFTGNSQANWTTGGYFGYDPLYQLTTKPIIASTYNTPTSVTEVLANLMTVVYYGNGTSVSNYLSVLGIKYVLINGDYSTNPGSILLPFSLARTETVLNHTPEIRLVKAFGPDVVYENYNVRPLIYAARGISINPTIADPYGLMKISPFVFPPTLSSWNSSSTPLVFPALLHSYEGMLSFDHSNWSYTNFGVNYSNLIVYGNQSMLIYFNYTANVTWPYLKAVTTDPFSIDTNLYNYLIVNYSATPGTSPGFQGTNESGGVSNLPFVSSVRKGNNTIAAYSLAGVNGNMTSLTLFYGSTGRGVLRINSIRAYQNITTFGTSWSYTNFGVNYSNLIVYGNQSMLIYFNYTANVTWPYLKAVTTDPFSIDTNLYNYLIVNYSATPGTSPGFQGTNESGGVSNLPFVSSVRKGNNTIAAYSLAGVNGNMTSLTLFYGSTGRGVLRINTIDVAMLVSALYSIHLLLYNKSLASDSVIEMSNSTSNQSTSGLNMTTLNVISPTEVSIKILSKRNTTFTLVFSQAYDSSWILKSKSEGIIQFRHVLVNGFANGWIISLHPGIYTFVLTYKLQDTFILYSYVSAISTTAFVIWLLVDLYFIDYIRSRVLGKLHHIYR